ncbi:MAG: hypothetical protein L6Q81_17790 [Bacteroidia bacterium]|nr:hypothetical protein [Bacteroidia bacterium]
MAKKNRSELYEEFKNGDIPNQDDFADTIDSALNLVDDGLTSYKVLTPVGELKRFGIGDNAPTAPLGIKGETGQDDQMICFTSADESQKWNINLNPTGDDVNGFSIDDQTSGIGTSRLFINQTDGNIGVNNVEPLQKLHVTGSNDGGNVSVMIENLESGVDTGWLMSAIDDNAVVQRQNTFAVQERNGTELTERITVLPTLSNATGEIKNVGVNEVLPFATLHVTKPASDPSEPVNLAENTGIVCLGQIDDNNLAMDSRRIQARLGQYVGNGTTLAFTASELTLQPYGGGLKVNSDSPDLSDHVSIDGNGRVGIGRSAKEKLEVEGAIVVGDTVTDVPAEGTIRFNEAARDLQVFQNGKWNSLTKHTLTDGLWDDGGSGIIYYNPIGQNARVGIGIEQPVCKLHVKESSTSASATTTSAIFLNQASTTSADAGLARIGLGVNCSGTWSPNPDALNIGLYIPTVTGQTNAASNIGAMINGNTVIGSITGNPLVGENGTHVLALQTGQAPTTHAGVTESAGVQLYSSTISSAAGTDMSVLNLMNGDGSVIQFFRQKDMTPSDINVPNTGNAVTDALIENMRKRIDELESMFKKLGLLNS